MKYLITTILASALLISGLGLTAHAAADEHKPMHKKHLHQGYDGKQCDHYKDHEGYLHRSAKWKSSLTEQQRKQYDGLKETFYQEKLKLKKEIKTAKMELNNLIASDSPKQSAIDKQIDAILKVKGKKMRLKVDYKIKVRKMLNKEQQKEFDEYMKNKSIYCKKNKGSHRH